MSACISREGEYSDHIVTEERTCARCSIEREDLTDWMLTRALDLLRRIRDGHFIRIPTGGTAARYECNAILRELDDLAGKKPEPEPEPTLTREELIEQLRRLPRGASVSYSPEAFELIFGEQDQPEADPS